MNTPSKEALEAATESYGLSIYDTAAIIDRHFEPLRRDNATLAGWLTAAELERDSLGARAEQAEQRVAELAGALRALSQAVHAKIQVQGADGNYVLSMDVASADRILARHASGEPAQEACGGRCGDPHCNLSTEGELMREPAKHPDIDRLDWIARAAIDMARQEVKP